MRVRISKSPSDQHALSNCVYGSPDDFSSNIKYLRVNGSVFTLRLDAQIAPQTLGTAAWHRSWAQLSLNQEVEVSPVEFSASDVYLSTITLQADFFKKNLVTSQVFDTQLMADLFSSSFSSQVFSVGQPIVMDFCGINLLLTVLSMDALHLNADGTSSKSEENVPLGIFIKQTSALFLRAPESNIKLIGSARSNINANSILQPNFKFEDMGIGGLDQEFSSIFRRAFASRIFPPNLVEKLGIPHVKGIILYGPPGTGKTLMARQIGKMLNARDPKIVNGPEILNKYVGQSEENIRNLFKDAEMEYKLQGENSQLHIIIFDELDAICRQRGSRGDGTGVGDSVVNQLLSKLDGVDQLNNILVIGMTNRLDMIDEALLRPGRMEIHMEIGLPDEHGRVQILKIHTAKANFF